MYPEYNSVGSLRFLNLAQNHILIFVSVNIMQTKGCPQMIRVKIFNFIFLSQTLMWQSWKLISFYMTLLCMRNLLDSFCEFSNHIKKNFFLHHIFWRILHHALSKNKNNLFLHEEVYVLTHFSHKQWSLKSTIFWPLFREICFNRNGSWCTNFKSVSCWISDQHFFNLFFNVRISFGRGSW